MYSPTKIEFDLKIKKYVNKNDNEPLGSLKESEKMEKIEWELVEELNFKSLSVKEVVRKIIDYLE